MPSDDERTFQRLSHKLSMRRRSRGIGSSRGGEAGVTQSMHLPSRPALSGGDEEPDVCTVRKDMPCNLNQSFFQMLTAAKASVRMSSRFDEDSDESGDEDDDSSVPSSAKGKEKAEDRKSAVSTFSRLQSIEESAYADASDNDDRLSDETRSDRGPAPFMSQILEAQAQMNPATFGQSAQQVVDDMFPNNEEGTKTAKSSELAKKLMEIFFLPTMEEVVSEYPCWLLKSVLLQGYMYITTNHVCFYAYLPKKTDVTTKSGYLSKRGKSNVKYTRYWFILKGDVLTYFGNPSELYFPNGHIDLRYSIQASLDEGKDGKDPTSFTITTDQRHYHLRADSAASAKEWVKTLQKVIFRTHNEGDSVKISIPIESVIEVEESPVLDFADTIKLKVVDNESYAIDEYFFSFFSFGTDALKVLQSVMEKSARPHLGISGASTPSAQSADYLTSHSFKENVRSTLTPHSPSGSARGSPRPSGEFSRASFDVSRRSLEMSREMIRRSADPQRHSIDTSQRPERFRDSGDRPISGTDISFGESSDTAPVYSDDEGSQSASQILSRSDVFRSPTIKKFRHSLSLSQKEKSKEKSKKSHKRDSSIASSMGTTIQIHPPSRRHTSDSRHPNYEHEHEGPSDGKNKANNSTPSLQDIARAGTYPLQRAAGWADWMKKRSKKMGTLIASQPMGYLEKVSDMWAGGRRHYGEPMGRMPDEKVDDGEHEDDDDTGDEERFRTRFALPETERLSAVYFGYLHRGLPLYGKIYLSNRNFCFRSILPGTKTKMILPIKDIENIDKEKGFRFGYSGLVLTIRGHEELFFEFGQATTRDDCAITLLRNIEDVRHLAASELLSKEEKEGADAARKEHQMLQNARNEEQESHDLMLPKAECSIVSEGPPIVFDDPHGSILNFRPTEPIHITCLTIGSRGDVQPFIALCQGFMKDGHRTRIATHAEFKDWIESFGIEFRPVEGDPAELMALCVEYGMFTVEFLKQTSARMRGWLDGLLESSWHACQGTDLLLESPSAMAGIHIAEALGIPYFRAFTMPWTRTRAYPHAFAVPEHKMGGAYNYFTYVIIDNVFWKSTAGQINRWRKRLLGLPRTSLDKLQPNKVPFLYNFSPSVVIPPLDYSDWIRVTGYWFLDTNLSAWEPPADLVAFIKKARDDGKKLVYVGFGSVTVADPVAMTNTVVESVVKSDVRCILSKGWSDRLSSKKDPSEPEVPLPPEILQIKSCPHDWLFKQVDAAVHHGGAGTTGASLRAGIPTVIKPFFGDQFFFANRVEDLGVGICLKKLNTPSFSRALWEATHNVRMIMKAEVVGEQIRSENGVETAIQAVYRDLEYARTLIKKPHAGDNHNEESEESWTWVGDESEKEKEKVPLSIR